MDEPTKTSVGRRLVLLILIGLGLLLLSAGVGWFAVDRLVIGRGSVTVPDSLAGLPLSERVTGRVALAEIERLHGKGFPLVNGTVVRYRGGVATLWVSSTWTSFLAARQVEAMTDRIAEGRSPFTPIGTFEVEGTTVYALTGMGQMHFYFQLDRRVGWLAVSPPVAEQSLGELIRNVR
jgi:hypothetical protein